MIPKEPFSQDQVREFIIAGHGNLPRLMEMLAEHPDLLNASYEWSPNDRETAIQAAAQVGSIAVAGYLLAQGAPLDICTAAMLGRKQDVKQFIAADPALINAHGAHGTPLLAYAAMSGNVALASFLVERGAREGMSFALNNAGEKGKVEMARWLLENGKTDLGWKYYQGKTALAIALERGDEDIQKLLRKFGAPEIE